VKPSVTWRPDFYPAASPFVRHARPRAGSVSEFSDHVQDADRAIRAHVFATASTTLFSLAAVSSEDRGLARMALRNDVLQQHRTTARPRRRHLVERESCRVAVGAGPYHADLHFHLQRENALLRSSAGAERGSAAVGRARRSEPNCANAAISRYWASSPLILPAPLFIAWVCDDDRRDDTTAKSPQAGCLEEKGRFQEDLPRR